MGVADSSLRGRVIFVEGSPRSGTTLLTVLLSSHPEVAGIAAESHLFDAGVGELFANHEGTPDRRRFLASFVRREELVDLVRELCDGVLERMRSRTRPSARFVLEKTPAARLDPEVPLTRKLECYPDAWYLHIVREGDAVRRSLMRTGWNAARSESASERWWREGVAAIRRVLGAHPRYREVRYEDLVADPVAVMGDLFAWLGIDYDDESRERVRSLSRERFAQLGTPAEATAGAGEAHADENGAVVGSPSARGLRQRLRAAASGVRRALSRRRGPEAEVAATALVLALRDGDAERLQKLTSPSLRFSLRTPDGDLATEGAAAREALLASGRELFDPSFLAQQWTVAPGKPFTTLLFSGTRHDGTRVDLCISALVVNGSIVRISLLAAGSLRGRPLRAWAPAEGAPAHA